MSSLIWQNYHTFAATYSLSPSMQESYSVKSIFTLENNPLLDSRHLHAFFEVYCSLRDKVLIDILEPIAAPGLKLSVLVSNILLSRCPSRSET